MQAYDPPSDMNDFGGEFAQARRPARAPVSGQVLIVARTAMSKDKVCIGGYDTSSKANVRLLDADGRNQSSACNFQIGTLWDMTYRPRAECETPHTEDVLVVSAQKKRQLSDQELIDSVARIRSLKRCGVQDLFARALKFERAGAAHICREHVPDHSVCFWRTDAELVHTRAYEKDKYHYVHGDVNLYLAYVGTDPTIEVLPAGSIARLSLARWWAPSGSATPKRCYLQLSGWY